MASDFLRSMAQKQAEKIDREFGANAYGGSEWRQKQNSSALISPEALNNPEFSKFVATILNGIDKFASLTNKNEQQQPLTLADLKAQRDQAQQKYNRADTTYNILKSGWGAASMQAKGGFVSNYLNRKATGQDAKQFDWQTFAAALETKDKAEKEIKALDAVINQVELDEYITQNYGAMDNTSALAKSEQELHQAEDEYLQLKKSNTIGAKSNSFNQARSDELAAAKEKYNRAKDVNTYFKDAVWWDEADVDRERL